jgi:Ca2+-binding RTX toxin-like protein
MRSLRAAALLCGAAATLFLFNTPMASAILQPVPTTCFGLSPTVVGTTGTAGNDVIIGTNGNDIIDGMGGNDVICGAGGDDTIEGGAGNDKIDGGQGADRIAGDIEVTFGDVNCPGGSDVILGGDGSDNIVGDCRSGQGTITGINGNDQITSGENDTGDALVVGDSATFGNISTIGGSDVITGSQGGDTIYGDNLTTTPQFTASGGGNDRIDGRGGSDWADGGPFNDVCITEARVNCEA